MTDLDMWIMAAGAAMIAYGILTRHRHWLARVLLILFGLVVFVIGMIFYNDQDHHSCR
jgi:hypothetical protein